MPVQDEGFTRTDLDNGRIRFDFTSLEPVEDEVVIQGQEYVLREADNKTAVAYRNAMMRAARMDDQGRVSMMDGMADAEPVLVHGCLFHKPTKFDSRGNPVWVPVVPAWVNSLPHRIIKPLFERARDISGLGSEKETPESLARKIADMERRRKKLLGLSNGREGDHPPAEPAPEPGDPKASPAPTTLT